jgi:glycosyltransferase involved in cell wall biosynthesis
VTEFILEDKKDPRILALVPAYNESERIGAVITAVKRYLPVLVVDDGSKDETSSVARDAGAQVLRQMPNQGKGAALIAGFKYGLENGYEAVITLDADGQHDPAEIPLFIQEFEVNGSDLVIGKRDFSKMPFPRNITNRIGTWSFSNAMQQYIPDNQSGYRLHSRRLLQDALSSKEHGFEFEVEIIMTCVLKGYPIGWIPIKTIYNAKQNSKITPLRHVWRFYRLVWRTRRTIRRFKRTQLSN